MRDEKMCREEGVEAIFAPDGSRMFPDGFRTKVRVEGLSEPLCGAHRPGHFDGVATVVLKLFNIVRPDVAFFGEKDYQQLQVIRQMTRDLDLDVRIESVPIVREADGLAMSSRNAYLSPEDRGRALCLSRSLDRAQALVAEGVTDAARILSEVRAIQEAAGAKIEYAELRDVKTLETRNKVTKPTLLALAAHFGATRLIDNRILGG
jgi:pantoate--beta-alanine ligase